MRHLVLLAIMLVASTAGCSAVIEPGHRGLLFDPQHGGLQRQVLEPGNHSVGLSGRIEDFDVTYSTRREALHVVTVEGLSIDLGASIIYRPIIAELYELDTEIGPKYYDEVVGPEFRSAVRACIARHSYTELPKASALEDEVERELRERIARKHIEVSAVTFENIQVAPEIAAAARAREVAELNARRKKIELESQKLEAEKAWERERIELERNVERRRLQRAAEGK